MPAATDAAEPLEEPPVNQVVIVEIPLADSIKSLGLFVNGTRVIGGHNLNQEHQIGVHPVDVLNHSSWAEVVPAP